MKSVKLKVDEARRTDVGRQIARIPAPIADELGVRTGDIIKIVGRRTSYARVWRSSLSEISPDSIKIEAITRKNVGVNLDEMVEVSPAKASFAKSVTLQSLQNITITFNLIPYLSRSLSDRVLAKGDLVPINTGFGGILYFSVVDVEPNSPVIVNEGTSVNITEQGYQPIQKDKRIEKDILKVSYESIGGLSEAIKKIREMIELPLRHPEIFERLGIQPPKGVLLYGPPGTGKTLLARAIASETSSHFIHLSGPEIMSKYYGESENKIREIFEQAKKNAPSIIFIDEIDSIAPKREETSGEVERRIVAQLLSMMDGLEGRGNVVVIGATNRPDSIDPALRRGGRFDREIEIGIPNAAARREILQIHTRGMPLADNVNLDDIANRTHGFVGADIEMLAKEAALKSLRRFLPHIDLSKEAKSLDLETLNKLIITMNDFEEALAEVSPSALREVFVEVPNIKWEDIGGLETTKQLLRETIEWPIKFPTVFDAMKTKPPVGILLYGPPGTGKTMLAKAVANETNANFISIKGPELLSKWVGESEKGVREIFRKARSAAPCIIFFDEIDAIASTRQAGETNEVVKRVVSQLLTEIDGLEEMKGVTILAASNRPDLIDPALMRPGRFDKVIFIGNPDLDTRKKILEVHLKGVKYAKNIDLEELAKKTEGFSGAEIAAIVSIAKMNAIREFINISVDEKGNYDEMAVKNIILTSEHIKNALEQITPDKDREYSYKPSGLSELRDNFM